MKSNTIRNDYAAARISAISAIIAAEAIGVTLLLILIQSLLKAVTPETSCQGLFIKKISNSIICCTMLVVYVIWLYN